MGQLLFQQLKIHWKTNILPTWSFNSAHANRPQVNKSVKYSFLSNEKCYGNEQNQTIRIERLEALRLIILNRTVRKGFTDKVISEPRLNEGEEVKAEQQVLEGKEVNLEQSIQKEEQGKCPKAEMCLVCSMKQTDLSRIKVAGDEVTETLGMGTDYEEFLGHLKNSGFYSVR